MALPRSRIALLFLPLRDRQRDAVMKSMRSSAITWRSSGIESGGYVPSPSIVTMMSPRAAAALARLEHDARPERARHRRRAVGGRVVDDHDLVDERRHLLEDRADAGLLVVARNHHRDALATIHEALLARATRRRRPPRAPGPCRRFRAPGVPARAR